MIVDYVDLIVRATDESGIAGVPVHADRFVRLAEVSLNQKLRVGDMEATTVLTTDSNGDATLPTDFLIERDLYIDAQNQPMCKVTAQDFNSRNTYARHIYYITGNTLKTSDSETDITLDYYQSLPGLEANDTNWLLQKDPELYLAAVLVQIYQWQSRRTSATEVEKAGTIASVQQVTERQLNKLIDDLNEDDKARRLTRTTVNIGGATP
jgi:hypothetical protein